MDHEAGRRLRARNGYRAAQACWEQARDRPGIARCHIGLSRLALDEDLSIHPILERLEQDKAVQRQPWLMGQVACLRGVLLGRAGDRLAYSVLAHAAALLDGHPAWRHLPAIDQGHLDLQRGDESAAYGRLGAVPNEALYAVPVRLALGTLRHSLGAALRATSA